jgi:hypothetical protein
MVARIDTDTFAGTLLTPPCDPSDSDELVLALETARALEAQGDHREAARWLRRAADRAERDGHDARVLALARAAAELTSVLGSDTSRQTTPDARRAASQQVLRTPAFPAAPPRASSPSSPRPRALSAPARPSPTPVPAEKPQSEAVADTVTVRVAIPATMRDSLFVVRRLAAGQELPPGTQEATLVLSRPTGH